MNPFSTLYETIIYRPLLNLLQFFYNLTGDIGPAIILLAISVNLLMWPLFASAYINGQKVRLLQPKLKKLRQDYKDDQQELFKQMREFNQKHGIRNSSIFYVLVAQILIASGLWTLTQDVSKGQSIDGLYSWLYNDTQVTFDTLAFGFLRIGETARNYIWLPILNSLFSFLFGYYTFRLAPKPAIVETETPSQKASKDQEPPSPLDPEFLQKFTEFQSLYFLPILLFILNFTLTAGVNLYFVAVSCMSLIRQVFLTKFYAAHTDKLLEEIAQSDPESRDNQPSNDLEYPADASLLAAGEVATKVVSSVENTPTAKTKKKSNKSSKIKKK